MKALNWIKQNATIALKPRGSGIFRGKVPEAMKKELLRTAKQHCAVQWDSGYLRMYNWTEGRVSWLLSVGLMKQSRHWISVQWVEVEE